MDLELHKNWKSMDESVKRDLVKKAREGLSPIGFCGLHCDYCFLGEWCGGCRSECNCCSFATMSEDYVCPNVRCATGRGLNNCGECEEMARCETGFYANTAEYMAKAGAMFLKEYGADTFGKTLKKAFSAGETQESFNKTGSARNAFELMEKYKVN